MAMPESSRAIGNVRGSAIVGGVEHFTKKYGRAAAHEVFSRLTPTARAWVDPHAPACGLLGTRNYPYAVVGELVRTMQAVSRAPEDDFIRDLVAAGMESAVSTVHRFALRYLVSAKAVAERAPSTWSLFHDCGRVTVLSITDNEYVAETSDWPNHDQTICRLSMEARRYLIERTGVTGARLFRERCKAWGDEVCVSRVRW